MEKVLVIEGPTAIGKTSFSIDVAKAFDGEIISGDSVQVYRGLDIGSGKIKEEEKQNIIHHLIDIRDPKETYTIYDFQSDVRSLIVSITQKGKMPIIVGGSGLYLKSALYDYHFDKEMTDDDPYDDLSNEELYARLQKVDPSALLKIHINNRRRLLRTYNYYIKNGTPFSENIKAQNHRALYDVMFVGLTMKREDLYRRIDKRVDEMIASGLLKEVDNLLKGGVTFDDKAMSAIGYKEWRAYYDKKKDIDEVIHDIKKATRNFAKRQYTWFNHQTPIAWYDIDDLKKAKEDIGKWYYG